MSNQLAQAASLYLRQHADQPIHWMEWGPASLERARIDGKPIFLSIGYSSCHWCHVMAHESFEDNSVAEVLNRSFVSIKVDREERPDLDELYMTAVQMATGRGGWPMSLFLTPEGLPFFAGTYIPRESNNGHTGFLDVCERVVFLWNNRRTEIEATAEEFAATLREHLARSAPEHPVLDDTLIEDCLDDLAEDFDAEWGGFGGAPKFPQHTAIELMLLVGEPESSSYDMAFCTLEKMALGGICDQVGGGFHRYSTDAEWRLPHFEKMLSDNGQLLWAYSRAAKLCTDSRAVLFRKTASRIAGWLSREMVVSPGLYAASLDADVNGKEGETYTWDYSELVSIAGEDFAKAMGAKPEGNFADEHTNKPTGRNQLFVETPLPDEEVSLASLLEVRNLRPQPGRDTKAIASWNAAVIRGLVEFGDLEKARAAAEAWISVIGQHGELPHQISDGLAIGKAFLDDAAMMAIAMLELGTATASPRYSEIGQDLVSWMIDRFVDIDSTFLFAQSGELTPIGISRPVLDSSFPSPNGLAIRALILAGEIERAERALWALSGWMHRIPSATETLHIALSQLLRLSRNDESPLLSSPRVNGLLGDLERTEEGLRGTVILQIAAGFHIQGARPALAWQIATKCEVRDGQATFDYPPGEEYRGEVRIPFVWKGREILEILVTHQVCSSSECYAPAELRLVGLITS